MDNQNNMGTTPNEPQKMNAEMVRQKASEIFADLRRYAREHRDLTRRNMEDFTARHQHLATELRTSVQKAIPKEEVASRVREVNDLVEKRLEHLRADIEKRYDDLEREIQETVERVFGQKVSPGATQTPPVVDVAATSTGSSSTMDGATSEPKKRRPSPN